MMAARTDRAGRAANQDNVWVCPNLSDFNPFDDKMADDSKQYSLSSYGAIMVVADGMGGMHSGEKASEIVIDNFKKAFHSIPAEIANSLSDRDIYRFLGQTFTAADNEIKAFSAEHPESRGMGSTCVVAWVVNQKVYIAWVGDSRAYCYNPANGLTRLTHDHSYVQMLVDTGQITPEEAEHHPQSNVITHSIGDTEDHVTYSFEVYPAHRGDVILLCSDGLCGLLNDAEIRSVIGESGVSNMGVTLEALWNAGEHRGWTDNATIALMRFTESPIAAPAAPQGWDANHPAVAQAPGVAPVISKPIPNAAPKAAVPAMEATASAPAPVKKGGNKTMVIGIAALIVVLVAIAAYFIMSSGDKPAPVQEVQIEETFDDPLNNPLNNPVQPGTVAQPGTSTSRPSTGGQSSNSGNSGKSTGSVNGDKQTSGAVDAVTNQTGKGKGTNFDPEKGNGGVPDVQFGSGSKNEIKPGTGSGTSPTSSGKESENGLKQDKPGTE